MSFSVQDTYSAHLEKGVAGQLSRANQDFYCALRTAGDDLIAGNGVYFDTATSTYKKPTNALTSKQVAGVVRRQYFSQNLDTNGDIVASDGDTFELLTSGHIFVVAGGDVKRGDVAAMSIDGTNKWSIGTGDESTIFVFDDDALADEIVSISSSGQTKSVPTV